MQHGSHSLCCLLVFFVSSFSSLVQIAVCNVCLSSSLSARPPSLVKKKDLLLSTTHKHSFLLPLFPFLHNRLAFIPNPLPPPLHHRFVLPDSGSGSSGSSAAAIASEAVSHSFFFLLFFLTIPVAAHRATLSLRSLSCSSSLTIYDI